jgi:uncharacterized protein YqeY
VSLLDRLYQDMREAMKAGQKTRLGAIRLTIAAIKKEAGDVGHELGEAEEIAVLQRAVKQRRESTEAYVKGNRPDLAQHERDEEEILGAYMPRQLSDDELAEAVREAIADTGASSAKEMGKVMTRLLAKYKGHVDGGRAREAVMKGLGS